MKKDQSTSKQVLITCIHDFQMLLNLVSVVNRLQTSFFLKIIATTIICSYETYYSCLYMSHCCPGLVKKKSTSKKSLNNLHSWIQDVIELVVCSESPSSSFLLQNKCVISFQINARSNKAHWHVSVPYIF